MPAKRRPKKKKNSAPEENLTLEEVLERYTEGPAEGIFTDGACSGNPGPGGWGMVWVEDGEVVAQKFGADGQTTNNRMELMALIEAYKILPKDAAVTLYSDSDLCVKTLNQWAAGWKRNGWKRKTGEVKNLDLVKEAYALHLAHPKARLKWIKAHDGSRWNEYADALATAYMRDEEPETIVPGGDAPPPEETHGLDVAKLRRDTPGAKRYVHLNNAGASLQPRPVIDAVREHLELESHMGGYEAAEARREAIDEAYRAVAELLGVKPRNVAMTENATVAFAQALSAIPFERGDKLLTTRLDYASNQLMYLSLHRRFGVEIVYAPDLPEGGVDPEAAAKLVREERPRLVAMSQMPSQSGVLQTVTPIAAACREQDVPLLVDACQTVGQLPIDVGELDCDFLAATSRKFLRGPRGAGFLYVADRALEKGYAPLFPDLHGARWEAPDRFRPHPTARRFENWEFAYALVLGTGAAARYYLNLDPKAVTRRLRALSSDARRRLAEIGGVRVLDHGKWLGAIVTFTVEKWAGELEKGKRLLAELERRKIHLHLSPREGALLDYADKGIEWALRASPHYFNTEEEIETLVEAVAEIVR